MREHGDLQRIILQYPDLNKKVRGHPELNQGPLDLQSNALPLSYIPAAHSNFRLPFKPTFFKIFPLLKPSIPSSIRKSEIPWAAFLAVGFVIATTMTKSLNQPFVMKVFEPFRIQSSPSRLATVRIPINYKILDYNL